MESVKQQVINLIKEYKYVALILAIGILLMLLPEKKQDSLEMPAANDDTLSQEERLEDILSQIQGVGKVRVFLSIATNEESIYVFDENSSDSREVVVITDSQRNQTGLLRQTLPPTYLGAVIVCQGGDQASVRLNIAEAVCDATGLSVDKITILKMK